MFGAFSLFDHVQLNLCTLKLLLEIETNQLTRLQLIL